MIFILYISIDRCAWKAPHKKYMSAKPIYEYLPEDVRMCIYPLVGCVAQKGTFALRAPAKRKCYKVVKWFPNFNVFILG